MIKANELRIGNKVYGGLDEVLTVTGIRETGVDTNEGSSNIVGINPIPLSPELLEKCGFVKDRNGWLLPNTDFSLTDSMYPCWMDKMLWPQDVERYKKYSLTDLHQLQNLYFALTGSEIEVNL